MTGPPRESAAPHPMNAVDCYKPQDIARLVEAGGVTKARAPLLTTLALGVLAGAFIALGGVFSTSVGAGSDLGFGVTRLLSGLAFSLGLVLVVVAGAELFTGNTLLTIAWVSRRISLRELLGNWTLVYLANLAGALSIAALVYYGRWWEQGEGAMAANALAIALSKAELSFTEALLRGIAANALVCLAIWLAIAGRSVTDKILAVVFPITAFVAAGFDHSIANMYYLPLGLLLAHTPEAVQAAGLTPDALDRLTLPWTVHNLAAVTIGNIIGGGILVGLVYWTVYLRKGSEARD